MAPAATLIRTVERLLAANGGRTPFVLRASLAAIAPSLALFGLLVATGSDTLRAPPHALEPAFVAYSVLLAPALETAVMLALAVVLARLLPGRVALRIVLIALLAALAHGLGGGWRPVLRVMWPVTVYAASVVLWLRRSARDAFVVTTIVHALYNAAFFAVGALGAYAAGEA
jgi:hypothetical protein